MTSLLSLDTEELREYLSAPKQNLGTCAMQLYNSCVNGKILTKLSADELRRIVLNEDHRSRVISLIAAEHKKGLITNRNAWRKNVWEKDVWEDDNGYSPQGQQYWRKTDSWRKKRWKYSDWTNPSVWFWNDASITCSGLIIIANIDNDDVYKKKHVIDILERSGLGRNRIKQKSIKICTWRAYVQLKNPKDVTKLKRFSTVRFPDNEDGKLVYIVHTPRRAFMRSGNWPLDMLFVIHHDKLETEYHEILDYSKTIRGDVYFAIAAMVKLSNFKTVVVLYRRSQLFQYLTQIHYLCGIKKITSPSIEDLSELTAILNDSNHDSEKGWNFIQKENLDPAKRTTYGPNPMSRNFNRTKTENWRKRYSKYNYQRTRPDWSFTQTLPWMSHPPWLGSYYQEITPPLHIMNPMPCITYRRPRKIVRHVLTPLSTSVPLKPKVKKQKVPRNTQKINWNMLMEGIYPKKPSNKVNESLTSPSIKKTKARSNNARQTQKMLAKQGTARSSTHKKSSNVSQTDVKLTDVDFKEQPHKEKTVKPKTVLPADSGQLVEVHGDHKSDSDA